MALELQRLNVGDGEVESEFFPDPVHSSLRGGGGGRELDYAYSSRIVGGSIANPSRYPYFAHLRIKTYSGVFQCGGTLIYPDVVMSAGHCYQDFVELGIEIQSIEVSVNKTTKMFRTGFEHERTVTEVAVHPDYNYERTLNDIVLFKLNQTVTQVPTPFLATPNSNPSAGDSVTAIGLGLLEEKGSLATHLQAVDIFVVSYDDCNDSNSYNGNVHEDNMICAGVEGGGKDACAGDSGGPILLKGDSPGSDIVFGITSWGAGCARSEKYGVYSKVAAFDDFIKNGVCDLSSEPPPICSPASPPTPGPTPEPTPGPTPGPSPGPTPDPTPAPTPAPTLDLGGSPSFSPSYSPTRTPTPAPVNPPTAAPSPNPTHSQIEFPTKAPEPPTSAPIDPPSEQPTSTPTGAPVTPSPTTDKPSDFPSDTPPDLPDTSECADWGDSCSDDEDCCSDRCLDTNSDFMGKRCFAARGPTRDQQRISRGGGSGGSGSGR